MQKILAKIDKVNHTFQKQVDAMIPYSFELTLDD